LILVVISDIYLVNRMCLNIYAKLAKTQLKCQLRQYLRLLINVKKRSISTY